MVLEKLEKLNIQKELDSIFNKLYKLEDLSRTEDPLDGDEVEQLTELIATELNYIQGNMTEAEYSDFMDKI